MTPRGRTRADGPERRCVVCRRRRPKQALLRVARSSSGVVGVDAAGTAPGRGAYVCRDDPGCRPVRREHLAAALRVTLGDQDLARLAAEIERELGGT